MSNLRHYSNPNLDEFRLQGDVLADSIWKQADPRSVNKALFSITSNKELSSLAEFHPIFEQTTSLIDTFDQGLLLDGQSFFERYTQEILAMLGFAALPHCYAHASGSKVLMQSQRIKSDIGNRLVETAKFVFDVCQKDSFAPKGIGVVSALKVRFIHSAIRFHVDKKGDWDTNTFGVPVNQVDTAGTNLAFSLITIRALRKLGIQVSKKEAEAYLYLWNCISHLMGLTAELLPSNMKEASVLSRRILEREGKFSQDGESLTKALTNHMRSQPGFDQLKRFIEPLVAHFIGDKASSFVGIEPNSIPLFDLSGIINSVRYALRTDKSFKSTYRMYNKQLNELGMDPKLIVPVSL